MCMLRYRIIYVEENRWKEEIITIKEKTIGEACLKFMETLNEMSKRIVVSEMTQIENN